MGYDPDVVTFLTIHKDQLVASNVPEHFWNALHKKLMEKTFDAGEVFQILKLDYDQERQSHEPIWAIKALSDINHFHPDNIYLVDHTWTFRVEKAREMLMLHDPLRERLCKMLDLNNTSTSTMQKEELVDTIFKCMWKINNMYTIGNAKQVEDKLPVWYIMDEIGISILHNDYPNCRVVPFYYSDEQITYSLLFPIEDIDQGDLLFRDYAEGISDPERKSAILLPWVPKSFREYSVNPPIPGPDYFLSGHVKESLPILSNLSNIEVAKSTLKVFTQYSLIGEYLTDNGFEIVENEEEADVLWFTGHFKDFETLSKSPRKFVNQFPFEYVLTVKDLFCVTCRRKGSAKWLPLTYNLLTEITNFVSYFQQRLDEDQDNYWIVKPYNLARSLDTHITDNLDYILKLSTTGPKIAQKYITKPVLFYRPECNGRVKFDIRYVILLKSVRPLEAYIYKNFFLRFANIPFDLSNFDNYEKHFTVMNYSETSELKHIKCSEFKIHWDEQYHNYSWDDIENSITDMLRDVLECATLESPPLGIAESPQSRALYAADLMLEWTENSEMQPKILEINFTPDCKRACDYYPDFYNDIFNLLFKNKELETFIKL